MRERRRYPRLAAGVRVRLAPGPEAAPAWQGRTRDVGLGGIALASPHPLLPGRQLELEFELPAEKGGRRWLRARGVVRWSRPGSPPVMMGVEFLEFEGSQDRKVYHDWIQRLAGGS